MKFSRKSIKIRKKNYLKKENLQFLFLSFRLINNTYPVTYFLLYSTVQYNPSAVVKVAILGVTTLLTFELRFHVNQPNVNCLTHNLPYHAMQWARTLGHCTNPTYPEQPEQTRKLLAKELNESNLCIGSPEACSQLPSPRNSTSTQRYKQPYNTITHLTVTNAL